MSIDNKLAVLRGDCIIIEKSDYGFRVHQWGKGGISPTSDYDTPQEAVARVAQLMKLKESVTPQSWPETACLGFIEKDNP